MTTRPGLAHLIKKTLAKVFLDKCFCNENYNNTGDTTIKMLTVPIYSTLESCDLNTPIKMLQIQHRVNCG